jgi:hypothetical protein
MTAPIGLGYYQRAVFVRDGLPIYLFHLRPDAAAECRRRNPKAFIVGRFDSGDDARQARFDWSAGTAAQAFFAERIAPAISQYPGAFSAILGINEAWPDKADRVGLRWRADFELALCRLVQARGVPYIWGAVSTGCLEAADVALFAGVWREAWAVNYHAYLAPHRINVAEESQPWNAWRPLDLWLPELRRLGVPLRLFVGELGPYYPELRGDSLARLAIEIHREMRGRCARAGVEYVGAVAYGAGLSKGEQEAWELENQADMFAAANQTDGATTPNATVAPTPPPNTATQPGGKTVTDFASPNCGGPRAHTLGIVVHSTRGGTASLEAEFDATVNWFANPQASVSAHAVVSPTRTARPVAPDNQAWHCLTRNRTHLGIEFAQPKLGDAIPESELQRGASVCAEWCVKYGIPTVWALDRGFVQHKDTPEGHAQGKSDIGAGFDGDRFMAMVKAEVARLTAPKPDAVTDALNGIWAYTTEIQVATDPAVMKRAAGDLKERVVRLKAALGR